MHSISALVGNSMIMLLWGEGGNAPMHLLHFGYPLGAVIGPLLASFYVSEEVDDVTGNTTTSEPGVACENDSEFADCSHIETAYFIGGTIVIFNAIVFIGFQLHRSCMTSPEDDNPGNNVNRAMTSGNKEESEMTKAYLWREVWSPKKWGAGDGKFGLTIVILVMLFFFLMVAAFKSSTTYLVFFATDELGMSNSEAAIFSSVVSAAGTMGRAISIGVASCVAIQTQFIVESFEWFSGSILWHFGASTTRFRIGFAAFSLLSSVIQSGRA